MRRQSRTAGGNHHRRARGKKRKEPHAEAGARSSRVIPAPACLPPARDREHGSPMPCHAQKRAAKERLSQETAYADGSTFLNTDAAAAGANTSSPRRREAGADQSSTGRRRDVAGHSQGARHTGQRSVHASSCIALGRSDVMGSQRSEMSGCSPPMTPTFVGQALNFDDLVKFLKSTLHRLLYSKCTRALTCCNCWQRLSQPAVAPQTSRGAAHCGGASTTSGSDGAARGVMPNAMTDNARRTRPTSPTPTCYGGGERESLLGMILHNGGSRASPEDEAKERALACASQENLGLQEFVSPLLATCRQAHVEHAQTGIQGAQECVEGGADGVRREEEEETGRGFTQLNIALDISTEEENDIGRTHSTQREHILETGGGFTQSNIALDISNVISEHEDGDGAGEEGEEEEEEEAEGNIRLNDSQGACEEEASMFARYTSKDLEGESAVGNMEASSSYSLNEALDVSDVASALNG